MQIALFDLDHTLIPFDSGSAFLRHLEALGRLDPGFGERYAEQCRNYAEGGFDILAHHRTTVRALAAHRPDMLAQWLDEFESHIARRVPPAALALVIEHRSAGRLCALVTGTTRIIAEPFARVLGLSEVLATEPARDEQGAYTGEVAGAPCFAEHKVAHVSAWLARHGADWDRVERSWFYSDSINDVPLLEAVTDPVAVDPDPRLAAHAAARGWPVLRLRDASAGAVK